MCFLGVVSLQAADFDLQLAYTGAGTGEPTAWDFPFCYGSRMNNSSLEFGSL